MSKVARHNEFALDLYTRLSRDGNLFFSPFSIRTVLQMAREGARGEAATQMEAALRLPAPDEREVLAELSARLRTTQSGYELNVANGLWAQEGAALERAFVDVLG